jgi:SAM-dependent methyltransferase
MTPRAGSERPCPPLELANRVCSIERWPDPLDTYDRLGADTKRLLLELLPSDWSFAGKRVLDFGCGAGRTLRHFLDEAAHAEIWGADIDSPSIEWLQANLCPPLHVLRNDEAPPLALEPASFDLIWALSVFTHLTDQSSAWLAELHRLLKPDGLLVATYMGRWNGEVFTHEPWDEDLIGRNILRRDQGWKDGGPMVLMSDWWVREHWGRAFEFVKVAPEEHGQTWALLRKRAVAITAEDLDQPADDPREWAALRHNLRQVERDRELAIAEVRRAYEQSWSWRVTAPARRLASKLRKFSD